MENTITLYEEPQTTAIEPSAAGPASLATVESIDAQIARAEKMGEALDKLRTLAAKRTVPGDWVKMGDTYYLEGDGALRIAPMLGLRLTNVRKHVEVDEAGIVRVTMTCDAASNLFGTSFSGIARTRTSADQFLSKGGKKADREDVESAAYKGMVARAVQLVAGLSGLSERDLRDRFGLDLNGTGSVIFKGATSEAKREDAVNSQGAIAEINKLLLSLFESNPMAAADWLERTTANPEKGWPGKRDAAKLTEKGAAYVLGKLQKMAAERREPGEEG